MAKQSNITLQFFKDKGYAQNADGSWSPPPIKSKYIRTQNAKNILEEIELVIKEKVNNSPDFIVEPPTEWFISGYNVCAKKNSRQNFVSKTTHKIISIPSKNHAEYVKMTDMQYKVFGIEFRKAVSHFELKYPLRVEFTFIRNSLRRADFTNLCQSVEDLMVDNKWLPDDDYLHLIPSFQPVEIDKNNFGVRIKLLLP